MIKKHQTCSIYATYQRSFFKQLLKETFDPSKVNPNINKENLRNKKKGNQLPNVRELF